MTITYPVSLLDEFPGTTRRFDLVYQQEHSPLRSGKQIVADVGPALWRMDVVSVLMRPALLKYWKARLASLENGIQTLIGYDMTAKWPIAYPRGTWPTLGAFNGIGALYAVPSTKAVRISGLPQGYQVSVGDYISFDYGTSQRALHQAVESAVADGDGRTAAFEVRPHIRPGYEIATAVSLVKPHALMMIVPDSVAVPGDEWARGTVSFSAIQTL